MAYSPEPEDVDIVAYSDVVTKPTNLKPFKHFFNFD